MQRETGQPAEMLNSHEQARAIYERLARQNPSVTDFQLGLAPSHFKIGLLQSLTGQTTEALASHERPARSMSVWRERTRRSPSFRMTWPGFTSASA